MYITEYIPEPEFEEMCIYCCNKFMGIGVGICPDCYNIALELYNEQKEMQVEKEILREGSKECG